MLTSRRQLSEVCTKSQFLYPIVFRLSCKKGRVCRCTCRLLHANLPYLPDIRESSICSSLNLGYLPLASDRGALECSQLNQPESTTGGTTSFNFQFVRSFFSLFLCLSVHPSIYSFVIHSSPVLFVCSVRLSLVRMKKRRNEQFFQAIVTYYERAVVTHVVIYKTDDKADII